MAFAAIAPALISGATSLIGGKMATNANNKAARLQQIQNAMAQQRREEGLLEQKKVLSQAQDDQIANYDWSFDGSYDAIMAAAMDAADNLERGSGKATDAYRTGEYDSTAELRRIQNTNAPGMAYLREIVGNPGALTDYQRKQLEDQRRVVGNTIRSSSLAGSGRTAAALLKNVESDYALKAQEQNRQQAMAAATLMAGNDTAAARQVAANKTQLGQQVGSTADALGRNLAQNSSEVGSRISNIYADTGARRAGVYGSTAGQISNAIGSTTGANANTDEATGRAQGGAAAANGQVMSQTAGAIGGAIADAFRSSKYAGDANTIRSTVSSGTGGLY